MLIIVSSIALITLLKIALTTLIVVGFGGFYVWLYYLTKDIELLEEKIQEIRNKLNLECEQKNLLTKDSIKSNTNIRGE